MRTDREVMPNAIRSGVLATTDERRDAVAGAAHPDHAAGADDCTSHGITESQRAAARQILRESGFKSAAEVRRIVGGSRWAAGS